MGAMCLRILRYSKSCNGAIRRVARVFVFGTLLVSGLLTANCTSSDLPKDQFSEVVRKPKKGTFLKTSPPNKGMSDDGKPDPKKKKKKGSVEDRLEAARRSLRGLPRPKSVAPTGAVLEHMGVELEDKTGRNSRLYNVAMDERRTSAERLAAVEQLIRNKRSPELGNIALYCLDRGIAKAAEAGLDKLVEAAEKKPRKPRVLKH